MYLLADTADTEGEEERAKTRQSKHESKFCSRGVARYYHRYDWDHSRKVSTIRSTMALLRGTIVPLLVSAFSVRQSALYLSRKEG
jgi:hypothetical protein